MLSIDTINRAIRVAEESVLEGKRLRPISGSPLFELCQSTYLFNQGLVDTDSNYVGKEEIASASVENYSEDSNNREHNSQLDELIGKIANSVSSHLSYARNVVLSSVKDYTERVSKDIAEYEPSEVSSFEVRQYSLPRVMVSSQFESEMKSQIGYGALEPKGVTTYGSMGADELFGMIQYGSSDYDRMIAEWLQGCGTDVLVSVWLKYWMDPLTSGSSESVGEWLKDKETRVDRALALYYVARGVKVKMPEGSGMSADELEEKCNEHIKAAMWYLRAELEEWRKLVQSNILVISSNSRKKLIIVNKPVYRDWIKNGGSNEALLGAMVHKLGLTTVQQYTENMEKCLKAWNTYVSLSETAHANKITNQYLTSLRTHYVAMLSESTGDEELIKKSANHNQEVLDRLERELAITSSSDIADLPGTCLRIMAKARYYYTDSYQILKDIDDALKANPELDAKQAALRATINYVTSYLTAQVKVEPV